MDRLQHFVTSAAEGMQKHNFKRGCLVGNLAQEVTSLPDEFRKELNEILSSWEGLLVRCLSEAKERGDIASTTDPVLMAHFFWIGWPGVTPIQSLKRSQVLIKMSCHFDPLLGARQR